MLNQTLKSWELTKWSPTKSLFFSAADFWDPEAYCSKEESLTLLKKITFYSHANETHFHNGGFEICLIPTMRVLRTWKWSFWVCFILEKNVWRLTRFLRSPTNSINMIQAQKNKTLTWMVLFSLLCFLVAVGCCCHSWCNLRMNYRIRNENREKSVKFSVLLWTRHRQYRPLLAGNKLQERAC